MHIPPANTKPKDVTKWYVNRALWRWTRNRKLDDGGGQYSCSQCAGRVTTNAKTRNPDTVPNKAAPYLRIEAEQCCHGMASVPVDLLDAYQDIPFGTPAHDKSYGRRNPSEKTISMIKDKGGLKAGWCRAFGLAAHTIGVLALAIPTTSKKPSGSKEPKPTNPPHRPGPRVTSRPAATSSPTASPHGHRPTKHTRQNPQHRQ